MYGLVSIFLFSFFLAQPLFFSFLFSMIPGTSTAGDGVFSSGFLDCIFVFGFGTFCQWWLSVCSSVTHPLACLPVCLFFWFAGGEGSSFWDGLGKQYYY